MKKAFPTFEDDPKAWLIASLSHKNEAIRSAALARLEEMGPAGVDLMLEVVRDEAAKRRKGRRGVYWGIGIYFGIIGTVLLVYVGHGLITGRWGKFPSEIFNFFSYMGAFGAYAAASVTQKTGTKWLAQYRDPRLVGPLVDALEASDKDLREVAVTSLKELLPTLPHDPELLSAHQKGVLRSQLKAKDHVLDAAILTALPNLGDVAAIPTVEGYLQRIRRTSGADTPNFMLAETALKELEAQKELAREKETLLRPAEAASETLLRPTYRADETDPALLLRPTNPS